MVAQGHRAVMLYLVQRTDCGRLRMAADLDPAYAGAFAAARAAGVQMLCYGTEVSPEHVALGPPLSVS
jgi:sugar fermentation stimulation protein A